jgi:hypothetical protein
MHADGTLSGVTDKQWPDKTLDISAMLPTEEEPTHQMHGGAAFQPGVAHVGGRTTVRFDGDATSTDVVGSAIQSRGPLKRPEIPLSSRLRAMRRGGRWSAIGAGILVLCWGIWAISGSDGDMVVSTLALLITLAVGGFLFGLLRLLGFVVIERTFNRVRTSAWLAHAIVGVFFLVVGFAYLQRVPWIIDAWDWIRGIR